MITALFLSGIVWAQGTSETLTSCLNKNYPDYVIFLSDKKIDSVFYYANTSIAPVIFKVNKYKLYPNKQLDSIADILRRIQQLTAVTEIYTGSIDKSQKDYALGYDKSENNRTLTVDYLMTDATEQTPIHFKFEALDGTSLISSHDLKTDIPIQRNWLTTVMGNILTTDAQLIISIDENFENDWIDAEEWWNPAVIVPKEPAYDESTRTYHIYTREEFAWLPDNILDMITKKDESGKSVNVTILLENDIDMSGVEWKPIYT